MPPIEAPAIAPVDMEDEGEAGVEGVGVLLDPAPVSELCDDAEDEESLEVVPSDADVRDAGDAAQPMVGEVAAHPSIGSLYTVS